MIAPLPGAIADQAGHLHPAAAGHRAGDRRQAGQAGAAPDQGGWLVITQALAGMLRTIYGDDERYRQQYWSQVPHCYFTADGARRDEDGYFWIMGRIDDVLNVAGHRLSTMEIESALVHHPQGGRGGGGRPAATRSRARASPASSRSRAA